MGFCTCATLSGRAARARRTYSYLTFNAEATAKSDIGSQNVLQAKLTRNTIPKGTIQPARLLEDR